MIRDQETDNFVWGRKQKISNPEYVSLMNQKLINWIKDFIRKIENEDKRI